MSVDWLRIEPETLDEGRYCSECGGPLSQSEMAEGVQMCHHCGPGEHIREECESSQETMEKAMTKDAPPTQPDHFAYTAERFSRWVSAMQAESHWLGDTLAPYAAAWQSSEDELKREIARLRSIVESLPNTRDGVPISPGTKLWYIHPKGKVYSWDRAPNLKSYYSLDGTVHWITATDCYSTREAAEAAMKGGDRAVPVFNSEGEKV